jgi:hypothetical protein
MTETLDSANAAASTLFLGHNGEWWDFWLIVSLVFAAVAAIAIGITTTGSIVSHKRETAATERELERYKAEASEKITASAATGETAKAEAARANESAAKLNNETARLQGDNLALQTVLEPRHVGLLGFNQEPPAKKWFDGIDAFAGTDLSIQFAPDFEAGNLANEIAIVLTKFGWKLRMIDEKRSQYLSSWLSEGVRVLYPTGKPWSAAEPEQPWFKWASAAQALAQALTNAGLGVGYLPVSVGGFVNEPPKAPGTAPYFDPPLEGVYLQVGPRPVALTMQWIKQGRPDSLGRKPAVPAPANPK